MSGTNLLLDLCLSSGGFDPRADPTVAVLVPSLLEATPNPALCACHHSDHDFWVQFLAQANKPKLYLQVGSWEEFSILGSTSMTVGVHSETV